MGIEIDKKPPFPTPEGPDLIHGACGPRRNRDPFRSETNVYTLDEVLTL